jgi:CcmD family protein
LKRWCAVVWMVAAWGIVMAAQQPTQQGEFIPLSELPPQEQLPAAPLLIGAYVFVLVVLFVYVLSVSRRLRSVQQEIDRLDTTIKHGGHA